MVKCVDSYVYAPSGKLYELKYTVDLKLSGSFSHLAVASL